MIKITVRTVDKAIGRAAWNLPRKRDSEDAAAIDVLAAEVQRLRADVVAVNAANERCAIEIADLRAENATFKRDNARLRAAQPTSRVSSRG